MVSVGNGVCSGGGFYLNPYAIINDGVLDISIFDNITRRRLLTALPLALFNKLDKVPEAKMHTTDYADIKLKNPYFVHCDGEIITNTLKEAKITIQKKAIKIITKP
jgi:diacylglycerol kinase family enzyme